MRVLKDPLLHFLLIGCGIFGWFFLVAPEGEVAPPAETIIVDQDDVDLLVARFTDSWKRPPTDTERQALIEALIREEVLVREARKLGLDRGDQVIRARLAQKMDFLTDAIASSVEPETDVLQAYLEQNAERFTTPRLIAFDQVFLGEAPTPADMDSALARLRAGEDWTGVGARTLLPLSLPLSAARSVDAAFGYGFSGAVNQFKLGEWEGPIQSGYGLHLVRITDTQPSKLPELEDIHDAVLLEWRRDTGEELAQAQFEDLAATYQIVTPETEKAQE
ncbi:MULTISPECIES: peptidylprolyl isomerase [unclassified Ruegeria]|uniref:peptidylprolyl isomerase n=1 Tax=unclassified Ruegeria TaxID=2625375 RepID=UPI0014892438|nr:MULTISPECIES: peptidylprolyl isomerase [unclassified Ruegeria]